jgi:excisionase family DNA binding protein
MFVRDGVRVGRVLIVGKDRVTKSMPATTPRDHCREEVVMDVVAEHEEPLTDTLLVTAEEAARRLSLGRTTVYDLISRGELVSVQVGRCRRVPVSELRAFVDKLIFPESAAPADTVVETAPAASGPGGRGWSRVSRRFHGD